ncbi:MAG: DNA-binding protein [Chitinophagaceae bacterium]|nr:MAG: DNA-binding protein [Chitinophagaceae bacterium]
MERFALIPTQELVELFSQLLEEKLKHYFATIPTPKETQLMSRKEAAKFLGISLPTLNEWSKNGLVIAHKVGVKVYYKKAELEQSLKQMRTSR